MKSLTSHSTSCHFFVIAFIPRTAVGSPGLPPLPKPSSHLGPSFALNVHRNVQEMVDTKRGRRIMNRKTHTLLNRNSRPKLVRAHFSIIKNQYNTSQHQNQPGKTHSPHTEESTESMKGNPQQKLHPSLTSFFSKKTTQVVFNASQRSQHKVSTLPPPSVTLLLSLSSLPHCFFLFLFLHRKPSSPSTNAVHRCSSPKKTPNTAPIHAPLDTLPQQNEKNIFPTPRHVSRNLGSPSTLLFELHVLASTSPLG